MKLTENLNVVDVIPLISPKILKEHLPLSEKASENVTNARKDIKKILAGDDKRLLVIVGPCSIHDPDLAQDYAERLKKLANQVSDKILIVMRVYFENFLDIFLNRVLNNLGSIFSPNLPPKTDRIPRKIDAKMPSHLDSIF